MLFRALWCFWGIFLGILLVRLMWWRSRFSWRLLPWPVRQLCWIWSMLVFRNWSAAPLLYVWKFKHCRVFFSWCGLYFLHVRKLGILLLWCNFNYTSCCRGYTEIAMSAIRAVSPYNKWNTSHICWYNMLLNTSLKNLVDAASDLHFVLDLLWLRIAFKPFFTLWQVEDTPDPLV